MDPLDTSNKVKFLSEDDARSRRGSTPSARLLSEEDAHSRRGSIPRHLLDDNVSLGGRSRSGSIQSRSGSVLTRIPTRPELKTLTRVVKRPAVDIEFTDLTYTVNTPSGEYFYNLLLT